jgi:serine phosphatase RsbU (regulator of sigma subunit)
LWKPTTVTVRNSPEIGLLAVVASHSEVSAEELTRTIYSSVVDFSEKDRREDDLMVVVLKAVSNTSD